MTQNKMGKMTSLSKLSGIRSKQSSEKRSSKVHDTSAEVKEAAHNEIEVNEEEKIVIESNESKVKVNKQKQKKKTRKKLVTVNIKIRQDQKKWLAETASLVRDNNTEPVPAADRVYPQHLIGVAIDLLKNADLDWDEVNNVEELREYLNL